MSQPEAEGKLRHSDDHRVGVEEGNYVMHSYASKDVNRSLFSSLGYNLSYVLPFYSFRAKNVGKLF
jgi:hypothetical protein